MLLRTCQCYSSFKLKRRCINVAFGLDFSKMARFLFRALHATAQDAVPLQQSKTYKDGSLLNDWIISL